MGSTIFNKEGERFEHGQPVLIPYQRTWLYGTVTGTNGLWLEVTLHDERPPAEAKTISNNLTIYGFTSDRKQVALW